MSHIMTTDAALEGKSVISVPPRQIILPRYGPRGRESRTSPAGKGELCTQDIIMNGLLCKLTEKELEKVLVQNEVSMKKKYLRMKKKMRQMALHKSSEGEVLKYFDGKEEEESLSSLLKHHTQNIELGKKYQAKLTNKIMSIKQALLIDSNKEKYRAWLNSCNNSPLKSPNYTKMNFVLEKVNKNKQLQQLLSGSLAPITEAQPRHRNQTHYRTGSKQNFRLLPLADEPCARKQANGPGEYSPKSKIKHFRSRNL